MGHRVVLLSRFGIPELLREHTACEDRYKVLVRALGPGWEDDDPIPLVRILETNGLDDALWALRAVPPEQEAERDRLTQLLACAYAERALPFYGAACPGDNRLQECIETSRRFARREATAEELEAAQGGVGEAAESARSAWAIARGSTRQALSETARTARTAVAAVVAVAEGARRAGMAARIAVVTAGGSLETERVWQRGRLRAVLLG